MTGVRIGIIGCGAIARRSHIPAFNALEGAEVTACASRSRASAEAAAAEAAGAKVFDDWRELIEHVDAVAICSPNAFHRDQAVAAAQAGKHVLVEKPIACTVEEADGMIDAAQKAGVVLQVAHNLRYIAPVIAARCAIADGAIGEIRALRAAFGHSGPKHWAPDATWFFEPESSGGGALVDLGIHIIDLVRSVTRLEASSVAAMMIGDGVVEDAAQVLVRYGSGAAGSIHASWVATPAPDIQLTVFGSTGTLHFDPRSPVTVRTADAKTELELAEVKASPFSDFVRATAGQAPQGPAAAGADGRAALAIVCAAYEAARTGRTVDIA